MYSLDGGALLWKGKPARQPRGPLARRLSDTYATDGRALFHAQKPLALPADGRIDFARLRLRTREENAVNPPEAVLDDGSGVWHLRHAGGLALDRLDGATFDTLEWFDHVDGPRHLHIRDHAHVWRCGQVLHGLAPDRAVLLTEAIAADGEALWFCGHRSTDLGQADVTFVWSRGWDDLLLTDRALLALDSRDGGLRRLAEAGTPPPPDTCAQRALQALARDVFGVFDLYEPILTDPNDIDWNAVSTRPPVLLDARFDGRSLVLSMDGAGTIRCEPDGWYRALCQLWHLARRLPGELKTYPTMLRMLPDGHAFRHKLIARHPDAYLLFCGAVFRQGAETPARMLIHAHATNQWHWQQSCFDGLDAVLATLPRAMMADLDYRKRSLGFPGTTNLAAARHAVESGLLDDADPRVRLEMLGLIQATLKASEKVVPYFARVLPAVLDRQERENVASVREHADATVGAFIIAGLVHAEVRHKPVAPLLFPLVDRQIARGVDVPLNRARMIELLIHERREEEALAAISSFKAAFGAGFRLPGVYAARPLHASVDEAVAAMRVRAAEIL
jgi:hypothetical protein